MGQTWTNNLRKPRHNDPYPPSSSPVGAFLKAAAVGVIVLITLTVIVATSIAIGKRLVLEDMAQCVQSVQNKSVSVQVQPDLTWSCVNDD